MRDDSVGIQFSRYFCIESCRRRSRMVRESVRSRIEFLSERCVVFILQGEIGIDERKFRGVYRLV